ncbi:MAG: prolyl aminopeptidase [Candidatus Lloydbacteria bacterium RIFCSPLOWO2_01_FULL_50_20]|uniref:Proline iminopeptidase n=1 Tax=Candidatus Lloydbacteria bacterium RIFCSPLOWO2_01_FULL_50_20 TaxID=1798665 RepID=A0A1G2DJ42_9BACT|nr:MAG: prolyl aminopeptidase [Candidatus Lloydbacteria bacterium RIFCSPHIGHO2_02_FULL_50_11]OGZ13629.1 MAG: prolyl aminopeptidase [Candidatus Lloydbacteria bacterium RIFCSPLOWO2_01_FULL_50_20]
MLYPEIEPYMTGMIRVSPLHQIYVEQCGNPDGIPAVFLHGGPGYRCTPNNRRFFDPKAYRIILIDQRGCGQSVPYASTEENTTGHLVSDVEYVRKIFGVTRWLVFGGSWGSTLALAYAEAYPECVSALVLRGIYLAEKEEIEWFYQTGVPQRFFPEEWQSYCAVIPEEERGDMVEAYWKRLSDADPEVRSKAAIAWSAWEDVTSQLIPDEAPLAGLADPEVAIALARIECHYFRNDAFLKKGQLLRNAWKLTEIPAAIVQGRYDMVCPYHAAWRLRSKWEFERNHAGISSVPFTFHTVEGAGHASSEPGITHRLIEATDAFRDLLSK